MSPATDHRLAEARSLAYHQAVADRVEADPTLLTNAQKRLQTWRQTGQCATYYLDQWEKMLALPLPQLLEFLRKDSPKAQELRQSTPFAGILSPQERWRLWKEVAQQSA